MDASTDDVVPPAVPGEERGPAWRRRVVERSLSEAARRSVDRGAELIFAAATLMEQTNGDSFTVVDVANLAKQSVRTVYVHFDGKDDLLLAVFEEAMEAYTRLVSEAIDHYEQPLERLAALVYFASRLSERATGGISVGIAKLRARFAITMPEQLARAQAPLTELFEDVVRAAIDSGALLMRVDASTFMVRSMIESVAVTRTLGNQYGLDPPDHVDLVEFTLRGFGATLPAGWERTFQAHWDSMPSTFSVAQDLRIVARGGR